MSEQNTTQTEGKKETIATQENSGVSASDMRNEQFYYVFDGRKKIVLPYKEVNEENIFEVLGQARSIHSGNASDIDYLWNYYKGVQPILHRRKTVNAEITNRIVENHAAEIVSFKVGYFLGNPIQYVPRGDANEQLNERINEDISLLNEYVYSEEKASKDKELADWMHICGVGYRLVLPDERNAGDDAPFEIYTLDPRNTFVVYGNDLGNPPIMGVTYYKTRENGIMYCCYTRNEYYEILQGEQQFTTRRQHILGEVPIIEYELNQERMGCFELVLPLLDAINQTASDRQDGVDQFVQALMRFHNVDISADDFKALRNLGAIKYKDVSPDMRAEVDYITQELNQSQTQTLVDYEYNTVLRICGIPNRNMSNGGTSDNGVAVELRDGWSAAETHAKSSELQFKKSEKRFLKLALRICRGVKRDFNLTVGKVEIRFTRRNYDNILTKSQVLTTMLNSNKIHPRLAFVHCGLFVDPELAYQESMQWWDEHKNDPVGGSTYARAYTYNRNYTQSYGNSVRETESSGTEN